MHPAHLYPKATSSFIHHPSHIQRLPLAITVLARCSKVTMCYKNHITVAFRTLTNIHIPIPLLFRLSTLSRPEKAILGAMALERLGRLHNITHKSNIPNTLRSQTLDEDKRTCRYGANGDIVMQS